MEEQKDYFNCPKCGMKNSINNTRGFCIHCGYNISMIQASTNSDSQEEIKESIEQQPLIPKKEKLSKGAIVFLIFSVIGISLVLPFVLEFGIIWMIFGAFSGSETTYYAILYACFGFAIASIVSLPASIINIILKGRYTKKCILIVIILTILGLLIPSFIKITGFDLSDIGIKKAQIEENKIIYHDDQYIVKQKEVKYNGNKINIKLEIDGNMKDSDYINGRVNKCRVIGLKLESEEKEDNIYIVTVPRDQLTYYQITQPKEIKLNLPLSGVKEVTIKTDKASSNNQQQLSFEEEGLLYQNEYFKIYYNPDFEYSADVYIESLISEDYNVSFKDLDFDTIGHLQSVNSFNTRDYSIEYNRVSFHPCYNNLSFLKGEYKIVDSSNGKEIASGTINETYNSPKIDKRHCRKIENN